MNYKNLEFFFSYFILDELNRIDSLTLSDFLCANLILK